MFLSGNFWINLRDYFVNKFSNLSFADVALFLVGIVFGFILFALIYVLFVLISFRKKEPAIYRDSASVSDEEIKKIIEDTVTLYKDEYAHVAISDRVQSLRPISIHLIGDIAKRYYPDSNHPISELSVDELIMLCNYITRRVDELLNSARLIKPFRKYRISKVLNFMDKKKEIEATKAGKVAKRANSSKLVRAGWKILHVLNPVYWAKSIIINPSFSLIVNKICIIIIRIVGDETAKVYSKSVFTEDDNIQLLIEELDQKYEDGRQS